MMVSWRFFDPLLDVLVFPPWAICYKREDEKYGAWGNENDGKFDHLILYFLNKAHALNCVEKVKTLHGFETTGIHEDECFQQGTVWYVRIDPKMINLETKK